MKSLSLIACGVLASGAMAQTSPWYITQGTVGPGTTYVMQGGAQINSYAWAYSGGGEMPIVVTPGYVRQASGQPGGGQQGGEYTLGGASTGLANYWQSPTGATAYDSATDGASNFVIDWNAGGLYKYDTNFGGGSFMFNVRSNDLGITYDNATGTIWTSNWSDGLVTQWDLGGKQIAQFGVGIGSGAGALAYDGADDTFWVASAFENRGVHFNRSGGVLGSISLPNYVLGGEISGVPTPGVAALLGLGGLAAARRRR